MEGGVRSGAPEQEDMHEHSVPDAANELAENAGEEGEEVRTARPLRNRRDPITANRAIHQVTNFPFRSWCAECVARRRDKPPHGRGSQGDKSVPENPMDCCLAQRDEATEAVIEETRRAEVGPIPVESAPHESESDGSAEHDMNLFQGLLRVHLLAPECTLDGNITSQDPVT